MAEKKRLFEAIAQISPNIWSNCTQEEVAQLQLDLENFAKKKCTETDESRAEKCFDVMQDELDLLEFDMCDSWGNENWVEPIVDVYYPTDMILRILNVENRWSLALKLSSKINAFLLEMISLTFENDSALQEVVCKKLSLVITNLWDEMVKSKEYPRNVAELKQQFSNYNVDKSGSDRSDVLSDCNERNARKALVHVTNARLRIEAAIEEAVSQKK